MSSDNASGAHGLEKHGIGTGRVRIECDGAVLDLTKKRVARRPPSLPIDELGVVLAEG